MSEHTSPIATSLLPDGSVVVPPLIRKRLGIEDGDTVIWIEREGQILLTTPQRMAARAELS
jgi:bifunctional DNA-binding transcriptional regulator/antitoxin component of YhaV-PrlF toxin-antitoxin module